ncbi:MAG: hypothetical protein AB7O60_03225 [Variibacter sp.]
MSFAPAAAIASVVPIPCVAAPTLATADPIDHDRKLIQECERLLDLTAAADEIEDAKYEAEHKMDRWLKRNRRPIMRETQAPALGSMGYEQWFKALVEAEDDAERERLRGLDPNRDLKAAIDEHESALKKWAEKRDKADVRYGLAQIREAHDAKVSEWRACLQKILWVEAKTEAGLLAQVRAAGVIPLDETRLSFSMMCTLAGSARAVLGQPSEHLAA